jgi:hypothetical protein
MMWGFLTLSINNILANSPIYKAIATRQFLLCLVLDTTTLMYTYYDALKKWAGFQPFLS